MQVVGSATRPASAPSKRLLYTRDLLMRGGRAAAARSELTAKAPARGTLTLQNDLLRAPVPDLADDQIVLGPAVDRVDDAEFFRRLAGPAEPADDLSVQPQLVDLAVIQALGVVRIRAVQILRRAARHADRLRHADVGDLRLERALAVEHLDALVAGIGHIEIALRIARDAADLVELALRRPGVSPGLREVALFGELRDAIVGAEPVSDVDVAGAIPRDVGRLAEAVARNAGSGSRGITASTAAATAAARFRSRAAGRQAAARRHAGAGPERDVLRFSAEHQHQAPVRVELRHHVRSGIDDPDVVLRVDAYLLSEVDPVHALADLLHELAVLIELEQARATVIERPLVAERRHRMAGARED